MNKCLDGEVRDALPDFVHGNLSGDTVSRVEQHLVICAECAAELELLRTARAALRFAPPMDVNRIVSAVQSAGGEKMAARRAWRSPARLVAVAAAAALVAIALTSRDDPSGNHVVVFKPIIERASAPVAPEPDGAGEAAAAPARRSNAPLVARTTTVADVGGLALGTHVGDLEEAQLVTLLESVAELEALPAAEAVSVEVEAIATESQ